MSSELFKGSYLFHLHTRLTDSSLTIEEHFKFAKTATVDRLIFLEHVRRTPTYDVATFAHDVATHASAHGLPASLGFEAKLLPDGSLDIDDAAVESAEVVGIAEHGFPDDERLLVTAFLRAIERYPASKPKTSFVWVHPGLWFLRHRRPPHAEPRYHEMMARATEAGVLIERNLRYGLLDERSLVAAPPDMIIVGADAHSWKDLERWQAARPLSR